MCGPETASGDDRLLKLQLGKWGGKVGSGREKDITHTSVSPLISFSVSLPEGELRVRLPVCRGAAIEEDALGYMCICTVGPHMLTACLSKQGEESIVCLCACVAPPSICNQVCVCVCVQERVHSTRRITLCNLLDIWKSLRQLFAFVWSVVLFVHRGEREGVNVCAHKEACKHYIEQRGRKWHAVKNTENAKMRCGRTSGATSQSVQSSSFPELWGSRTGHLPHCGHPAGNNVRSLWSRCPLTHANNPHNLHLARVLTHWQRGKALLALDSLTTSGTERGSPGSQISKMEGCQKATARESRSVSLCY